MILSNNVRKWRTWLWAPLLLATTSPIFAASPWLNAATVLKDELSGPLARALSVVAVVISGLTFAYGEGDAKRLFAGVLFGCAMAVWATPFLAWMLGI